ncbi:Uncharacterised protein [Mycobacteroides abscessus subsp. massiliense]|nr:Uncharacterised protein [Mycobacteroides abscessus subsp. massiliense]
MAVDHFPDTLGDSKHQREHDERPSGPTFFDHFIHNQRRRRSAHPHQGDEDRQRPVGDGHIGQGVGHVGGCTDHVEPGLDEVGQDRHSAEHDEPVHQRVLVLTDGHPADPCCRNHQADNKNRHHGPGPPGFTVNHRWWPPLRTRAQPCHHLCPFTVTERSSRTLMSSSRLSQSL